MRFRISQFEQWELLHRSKLFILILVANGLLSSFFYFGQEPVEQISQEPLALVNENSIHLVTEDAPRPAPVVPEAQTALATHRQDVDAPLSMSGNGALCRAWGPAETPGQFDELFDALQADRANPEIVAESVDVPSQFFVYHETDLAKDVSTNLTELGVDNYVISRDTGTIISAGVFSRLATAERQQERLKTLGYPAVIEVMQQRQTSYRLTAQLSQNVEKYLSSSSDCTKIAHSR